MIRRTQAWCAADLLPLRKLVRRITGVDHMNGRVRPPGSLCQCHAVRGLLGLDVNDQDAHPLIGMQEVERLLNGARHQDIVTIPLETGSCESTGAAICRKQKNEWLSGRLRRSQRKQDQALWLTGAQISNSVRSTKQSRRTESQLQAPNQAESCAGLSRHLGTGCPIIDGAKRSPRYPHAGYAHSH